MILPVDPRAKSGPPSFTQTRCGGHQPQGVPPRRKPSTRVPLLGPLSHSTIPRDTRRHAQISGGPTHGPQARLARADAHRATGPGVALGWGGSPFPGPRLGSGGCRGVSAWAPCPLRSDPSLSLAPHARARYGGESPPCSRPPPARPLPPSAPPLPPLEHTIFRLSAHTNAACPAVPPLLDGRLPSGPCLFRLQRSCAVAAGIIVLPDRGRSPSGRSTPFFFCRGSFCLPARPLTNPQARHVPDAPAASFSFSFGRPLR